MFPSDQASQRAAEDVSTIVVDARSRRVSIDGVQVHLTPIEYRLLEHLVREAGRVVSRDELLSAARQREAGWHDRALDVHVSHLRAKLTGHRQAIRTVRGEGYVFWAGLNTAQHGCRAGDPVKAGSYNDAGN